MKDTIDRTVIGAVGGIMGGLASAISLETFGIFIEKSYPKVMHIALLFIPAGQDHTFGGKLIAYFAQFTIASLLGILYVNIFRLTGRDWATTKGLIFGAATWIIIFGIMGKLLNLPEQGDITVAFILIIGHLIFGVVTSWSVYWLSEKAKL
ncbi:MAG: hypothetical protein CVV03_01235 [Firmicutes bacterium HGW-Firmicutes-8]|nr:MAG: hypothetical protein CVV03_01235 [Firmicutes bacterium HGW-Firmicutes-8]